IVYITLNKPKNCLKLDRQFFVIRKSDRKTRKQHFVSNFNRKSDRKTRKSHFVSNFNRKSDRKTRKQHFVSNFKRKSDRKMGKQHFVSCLHLAYLLIF